MLKRLSNLISALTLIGRNLVGRSVTKKSTKKIVIIQTAKLGDMVCTTPLFSAIKKSKPSYQVVVLGNSINQQLLANHPHIDQYFIWSKSPQKNYQTLINLNAEIIILTTPNFEALATSLKTNAPQIIAPIIKNGFSPYQTKSYRLLSSLVTTVPHRMGHYAPGEYLHLLNPLGIESADTTKTLTYTEKAKEDIAYWLKEHSITPDDLLIIISPSAGNKIKNWGGEKFAQIADYLVTKYQAKIVIIGTSVDQPEIEKMESCLTHKEKIWNTLNLFNIDELKALIAQAKLFISVDTGPIYIAEAFNVPTIDIVGPMDENEQPPQGPKNLIVKIKREKPELHIMNARQYNEVEALRQITEITPEMVIDKIDQLLTS